MIDDLIKKLLALPKLEISPETSNEFQKLTNHLVRTAKPITLENFNTLLAAQNNSCISIDEMKSIASYLTAWEQLMTAMDKFIPFINSAWKITRGKPIDADNLLPLLMNLLPTDDASLTRLLDNLSYARDVDQMHYHINALCAAAEYLIDNRNFPAEEENVKYQQLVRDARMDDGLIHLHIAEDLEKICHQKMEELFVEINRGLVFHNIHDYDCSIDGMDKPALMKLASEKIMQMYAGIDAHPFSSYPEVAQDVRKFIAYHEFLASLDRKKSNNVFERLRELNYKFPVYEHALGHDLDTVTFTLSDAMQIYLGVPDDRKTSMFNLLWTPPKNNSLPLRKFMGYFDRKMREIEAGNDRQEQPVCIKTVGNLL